MEKPWLDPNGQMYGAAALKEISKRWCPETWERFLIETVDRPQADAQVSSETYEELINKSSEPAGNNQSICPDHHFVALKKAMSRLTTQQSQILRHLFWDNRSIRETAKLMGVSKSLVSIQKQNSLKKLKGLMEIEMAKSPYSVGPREFHAPTEHPHEDDIRDVYLEDIKGSYLR